MQLNFLSQFTFKGKKKYLADLERIKQGKYYDKF